MTKILFGQKFIRLVLGATIYDIMPSPLIIMDERYGFSAELLYKRPVGVPRVKKPRNIVTVRLEICLYDDHGLIYVYHDDGTLYLCAAFYDEDVIHAFSTMASVASGVNTAIFGERVIRFYVNGIPIDVAPKTVLIEDAETGIAVRANYAVPKKLSKPIIEVHPIKAFDIHAVMHKDHVAVRVYAMDYANGHCYDKSLIKVVTDSDHVREVLLTLMEQGGK